MADFDQVEYDDVNQQMRSLLQIYKKYHTEIAVKNLKLKAKNNTFEVNAELMELLAPSFYEQYVGNRTVDEEIHLEFVNDDHLKSILDYIYTGEFNHEGKNMFTLLEETHKLRMQALAAQCCEIALESINGRNCVRLLYYCEQINATFALMDCLSFVKDNLTDELMADSHFNLLTIETRFQITGTATCSVQNEQPAFPFPTDESFQQPTFDRDYKAASRDSDSDSDSIVSSPASARFTKVIAVFGGESNNLPSTDIEVYDSQSERWTDVTTTTPSSTNDAASTTCITPMPKSLRGFCVAVNENILYILGGGNGDAQKNVYRYDTVQHTWVQEAPMLTKRSYFAVAVAQRKIFAVGGSANGAEAESLDAATTMWNATKPMAHQRQQLALASTNDVVYAIGGHPADNTAEAYVLKDGKWSTIGDMVHRRIDATAAALNGLIYVAGGFHRGRSVEFYCPPTDTWEELPNLNNPRQSSSMVPHDGKLYIVGGNGDDDTSKTMEVYYPEQKKWTLLQCLLKHTRSAATAVVVDMSDF